MSVQHQDLTTKSISDHIIRATRINNPVNISLMVEGHDKKVINYSTYGVAFLTDKEFGSGHIFEDCQMSAYGTLLLQFSCIVKRCSKTIDGNFEIGAELLNQEIDVNSISSMSEIQTKISEIYEKENHFSSIPAPIRELIHDLERKLHNLERIAKSAESIHFENAKLKSTKFEIVVSQLSPHIFNELKNTNRKIQDYFKNMDANTQKLTLEFYRGQIGEYVLQSNFTKRSFLKPRGYAGDFEMMNQLYRNDNFSNTLFGSCIERAVNFHEEPEAVRNRASYLSEKIVSIVRGTNSTVRILAVACGPAEEIKVAISKLNQEELNRIQFDLLDQDVEALLYAQQNIRTELVNLNKSVTVNLINKSIKEILVSPLTNKYELIYSAGLFDYFSDAVASRACSSLAKNLKAPGRLIIGNFNTASPNWFGMLALFDWFLILRSEEDLKRIFRVPGSKIEVEKEPNNVNLFCNITI